MTDQEYEEIKIMLAHGMSTVQATVTPARRLQFIRLRKKKGEGRQAVASVIREAVRAANAPIVPEPAPVTNFPQPLTVDQPAPNIRELVEMAKRMILKRMQLGYYDASCIKLILALGEKELPEWSLKGSKAAKDEYQEILNAVVLQKSDFKILERKEPNDNDNAGNENKASAG